MTLRSLKHLHGWANREVGTVRLSDKLTEEGLARIGLGRSSGLRPVVASLRRPKRWRVLSNPQPFGLLRFDPSEVAKQKGPLVEGAFLFWRARKDSNLRPPGS